MHLQKYQLEWDMRPRIVSEHLGSHKYSTSTRAISELVANAFDAAATLVDIKFNENPLGGFDSLTIQDNGNGIHPDTLRSRFMSIGVEPSRQHFTQGLLGRFGVGRLAVFRIGSHSKWTSVSKDKEGKLIKIVFDLRSEKANQPIEITQWELEKKEDTGTVIQISNLLDKKENFNPRRTHVDLTGQYCSFLLANKNRRIRIQNNYIDMEEYVECIESERIDSKEGITDVEIQHIILNRSVDASRFPEQIIFSGKGRTVATMRPDENIIPEYLSIVECPFLNEAVTSNREALLEMDSRFLSLKSDVQQKVCDYSRKVRSERRSNFIDLARRQEYYPYQEAPADAVEMAEKAIYDVVLEKVNEQVNIESMNKRQQAIIFRLLKRCLMNENLFAILNEVIRLKDEDIEKFKDVLEYTTLNSIIKLSSEVTERLLFLDILHEIVYGESAKSFKERSQLHKIIEPNCWIFSPRFHLATSDESFRSIIAKHREIAGLNKLQREEVEEIPGISDIPDLFLAAARDYYVEPKHQNVLVELKAPRVALGSKEASQIRRYGQTIQNSDEFDKSSTHWDIFLVSSKISEEIELDRNQKGRPAGCLYEWENMTLWAFTWAEIIQRARDEMQLVRDHLRIKLQHLTINQYLQDNFPDILH